MAYSLNNNIIHEFRVPINIARNAVVAVTVVHVCVLYIQSVVQERRSGWFFVGFARRPRPKP